MRARSSCESTKSGVDGKRMIPRRDLCLDYSFLRDFENLGLNDGRKGFV